MPELPEVETIRQGVAPGICGRVILEVVVREHRLRQPIPVDLLREKLPGQPVQQVLRRGKYLLLQTPAGHLLMHLGMSGVLRLLPAPTPPARHDHLDLLFAQGPCLRYTDPRRFGLITFIEGDPARHPLLAQLGPEPLEETFTAPYLHQRCQGRKGALKAVLMDGAVVVGVGNIYASEALFSARLHPARPAESLTPSHCRRLVNAIQTTLKAAIAAGGSTLRDFAHIDGRPGYFQISHQVYGRQGHPCPRCQKPIESTRIAGRNSFFCPGCQT